MITRIWHGETPTQKGDDYLAFLLDGGTKDYRETDGNLGIEVWKQDDGPVTHFWTVTRWKDLESIKRFAGEDIHKAKYYPIDKDFLVEFEPHVIHRETFPVDARHEVRQFIRHLKDLYDGEPWFGNCMLTLLNTVTAREARTRPLPDVHSIVELMWHMIYWRNSLIKKLEGDLAYKASIDDEDNWRSPEHLKDITWDGLREEFRKAQDRLIDLLSAQDDSLLDNPFDTKTTFRSYINGIIQHDIYHLGQMGLVRKMVRGKGPPLAGEPL